VQAADVHAQQANQALMQREARELSAKRRPSKAVRFRVKPARTPMSSCGSHGLRHCCTHARSAHPQPAPSKDDARPMRGVIIAVGAACSSAHQQHS
jgi:hypothetical protein